VEFWSYIERSWSNLITVSLVWRQHLVRIFFKFCPKKTFRRQEGSCIGKHSSFSQRPSYLSYLQKIFNSILQLENQIFVANITDLQSLKCEVIKISIFLINSIKTQEPLGTKVISLIQKAVSVVSTTERQRDMCPKRKFSPSDLKLKMLEKDETLMLDWKFNTEAAGESERAI